MNKSNNPFNKNVKLKHSKKMEKSVSMSMKGIV